jgi:hypothetical protein
VMMVGLVVMELESKIGIGGCGILLDCTCDFDLG